MLYTQNSLNKMRLIHSLNTKKYLTLCSMVSKCVKETCGLVLAIMKCLTSIHQVLELQPDAVDLPLKICLVLKELPCSEEYTSCKQTLSNSNIHMCMYTYIICISVYI